MKSQENSNKLVLYNTLSTIILYAITFFSAPLFSRLLGKNEYGVVQVYNTWVTFFVVISGLYTRGTLAIAKINFSANDFKKYQSSVLFLSVVGFSIILGIVIIASPIVVPFFGLKIGYLILMMFHSFGTYCVYFINTKFTYEMKAKNNLIISVSLAMLNFVLSYVLIKTLNVEHLYLGRILGMSFPYIVAGFLIIIYVFYQGKTLYNRKYWKFCFPLCIPLIFHGISGVICASSDRIMVQQIIGIGAVGIYSLAYNFANSIDSVWNALHNSWDPFFFEYIKTDKYDELLKRSKKYIRLFTCISIVFILCSPEVFHIFASKEYWEGATIIPIVILSEYSIFVYSFAANYEFAFKRTDVVAIGSVIAGIVNIVLNFWLINVQGYFGAALATLLSNMILAIVHIMFARKLVKDKWIYSIKLFIPAVMGLIIAVVLYYYCFLLVFIRYIIAVIICIYICGKIYKDRTIF